MSEFYAKSSNKSWSPGKRFHILYLRPLGDKLCETVTSAWRPYFTISRTILRVAHACACAEQLPPNPCIPPTHYLAPLSIGEEQKKLEANYDMRWKKSNLLRNLSCQMKRISGSPPLTRFYRPEENKAYLPPLPIGKEQKNRKLIMTWYGKKSNWFGNLSC